LEETTVKRIRELFAPAAIFVAAFALQVFTLASVHI